MADWDATEDFEYSVGGLNGQNGGTNWSGAWSTDAGLTVVSSPTFSGSGACAFNNVTGCDGSRALSTSVTSGIVRIYMYATNVPTLAKGFFPALFRDGGTIEFRLSWGVDVSGNNVGFGNGTSTETIGVTPAAATWHYADVEFDQANNRARASFNGGAWSNYVTAAGGTFAEIDNIRLTNGDANASDQGYYIDDIGVGTGPPVVVSEEVRHDFITLGVGT